MIVSEEKAKYFFFIPLLAAIILASFLISKYYSMFMGITFGIMCVFVFFAIRAANSMNIDYKSRENRKIRKKPF